MKYSPLLLASTLETLSVKPLAAAALDCPSKSIFGKHPGELIFGLQKLCGKPFMSNCIVVID